MLPVTALLLLSALAGASEVVAQDPPGPPEGAPEASGPAQASPSQSFPAVEPNEPPPLSEDRRLLSPDGADAPTAPELEQDELSTADLLHFGAQAALVTSAGWLVAAPLSGVLWVAAGGLLPAGFSFLVLVPALPLLLLGPPAAVTLAAAAAGWGHLTWTGALTTALVAGGASAAAALVVGPFALARLLTPPSSSNPDVAFRVTWTLAAGALWLVPAAAGGLAAGIAAPFFFQPAGGGPEEGDATDAG